MPGQGVRVMPLFAVGGGVMLLWSGLTGRKISTVLKDLISGQNPVTAPKSNTISGTPQSALGYGYGAATLPSAGKLQAVSGGNFTHGQLMSLWIMNGGSSGTANNAACHAVQESSGNPRATSPNPDGGTNVGLWQLDTPGGKGAGYTIQQLMNPNTNARVAIRGSSNGTDWSAWSSPGC